MSHLRYLYLFVYSGPTHIVLCSLINTTFWICFALGRLTGLFTGRFVPIRILILIEVSGALVTSILLDIFARDSDVALWVLTCPMGFFISPLFPSGIGWGDFHVEFTGFAITFALMGGALGGVSYLWVIGILTYQQCILPILFQNHPRSV
jgi:fucose permease